MHEKRILRVVVLLATLGAIGLGVGGYGYYWHRSQQRSRELSIAHFTGAQASAATGAVIYLGQTYPVAKGSPLGRELVPAVLKALNTGEGPVSYYQRTDQATVFVLLSDRGDRLCEVHIEDEFVQVDGFDALLTDVPLKRVIASHLFADK